MSALARGELTELVPFVRRCADLDPAVPIRLRTVQAPATVVTSAFAVLPFDALVERTVATPTSTLGDRTVRATELLAWLETPPHSDDDAPEPMPPDRGSEWRGSVPPTRGWRRVEDVPDDVVRDLVRTGAVAAKEAATAENLPSGQPSDTLVGALLDSVVLSVTGEDGARVEVTLRALTAATRMGFVRRDSGVRIDRAGRWTRVAATFGNVYLEARTSGLTLA